MNTVQSRRAFFADVGRGMIVATIGSAVATDLGLAGAFADETKPLTFGALEPLVCLMQETPVDKLLPRVFDHLKNGTTLTQVVTAAALANARTFGGEDYVGYHTMMALSPALHMAKELPPERQALPVFKVLYRNTNRIQERGGRSDEVLRHVEPAVQNVPRPGEALREKVRAKDAAAAEQAFSRIAREGPERALNELLLTVQDTTEVHRVVLPYRAWDLLNLIGREHAHTLLRQSVRYCVRTESLTRDSAKDEPRVLLPKLLEQHRLMDRNPGTRHSDNQWAEEISDLILKGTPADAAVAAAGALAENFSPAAVGEAISLAANQLVLRDMGRPPREESPGKPTGSVHGDSIGVHACDSANAWRNMASVSRARNTFACLILGAYQVALDRRNRGGDFLNWQPLPVQYHLDQLKTTEPSALLQEADDAIRQNLQARAAAVIHRYGKLGHDPRPAFDLMLRYAISEDGALHAEKYYRTASEEFARTREAFRWRHLVALARVTASEFGRPAPGMAQARELLKA